MSEEVQKRVCAFCMCITFVQLLLGLVLGPSVKLEVMKHAVKMLCVDAALCLNSFTSLLPTCADFHVLRCGIELHKHVI